MSAYHLFGLVCLVGMTGRIAWRWRRFFLGMWRGRSS